MGSGERTGSDVGGGAVDVSKGRQHVESAVTRGQVGLSEARDESGEDANGSSLVVVSEGRPKVGGRGGEGVPSGSEALGGCGEAMFEGSKSLDLCETREGIHPVGRGRGDSPVEVRVWDQRTVIVVGDQRLCRRCEARTAEDRGVGGR